MVFVQPVLHAPSISLFYMVFFLYNFILFSILHIILLWLVIPGIPVLIVAISVSVYHEGYSTSKQ